MTDFFTFLLELLKHTDTEHPHWPELIVITLGIMFSLGLGGLLAYVVSWFEFRQRAFFDQVVIGVNVLEPNRAGRWTLTLRTLREDNIGDMLDNPVLERLVEKAAKRCTKAKPVLILKKRADHQLLMTKIQNVISSFFARDYLLMMVGHPSFRIWVDFVVTCEQYGGLKATKIRVLVFFKTDLRRFLHKPFLDLIDVEEDSHKDRLRTLEHIAHLNLKENSYAYGSVEIPIQI